MPRLSNLDRATAKIGGAVSDSILNWTSRVAFAGRIAECRGRQNWNELTILGDYHLPFGKAEAQAKAARWLWQSYII
jgi:hypothetical protein